MAEIYDLVRAGRTPAEIARGLTGRHPAPGAIGRHVTDPAATRSAAAVSRIVRSPQHAGLVVFGKSVSHRDASTGEACREHAPPSEWRSVFLPHLQIVDVDVWRSANAALDERAGYGNKTSGRSSKRSVHDHLLTSAARLTKGDRGA